MNTEPLNVFLMVPFYTCLFASLLESRPPNPAQTPSQCPHGWAHIEHSRLLTDGILWIREVHRQGDIRHWQQPPIPEFCKNKTHTRESREMVAAKTGSETCQGSAGMAASCFYVVSSRSRCRLLLRLFPRPRGRTGLILISTGQSQRREVIKEQI